MSTRPNSDVQKCVISRLAEKADIPVVAVGTPLPDFVLPDFHFINTSDRQDIEEITDHLIEVHWFTDIHILSGYDFIDASVKRVEGYRESLEKHGIPFDENKAFFGDFWFNSGRLQAEKYISGEIVFPQAVICCNDYMAYGMLDVFMEHDVKIPEKLTITGYEYIHERRDHDPLLTTYQRNRRELGRQAVRLLREKLVTGEYGDFFAPRGRFIYGNTCGCGADNNDIRKEIAEIRTRSDYDFLNLFCQFEHRFTECRNVNEFAACCRKFRFMIRNVDKLYMCLYENWYNEEPNSENMIRYDLLTYDDTLMFNKNRFSAVFGGSAAPYYFSPLFFGNRELGVIVLRFDSPDTYDHVFRNLMKALSNTLEFLRMKNDIQYMMQCQNIAEQRDTLTGILNEKGLKKAFCSADKTDLYVVGLQICLFEKNFSALREMEKIDTITDAAKCLVEFCGSNDICERVGANTFIGMLQSRASAELLEDRLRTFLCQHREYMSLYGMDSFVCHALSCGSSSYADITSELNDALAQKIREVSDRRSANQYMTLNKLRTYIYTSPVETFDMDSIYSKYSGSVGHLRSVYKNCFGISLLQDCISARMAKAKYLLMTTSMNCTDIAEACGYADNKYFMRQFSAENGMTASHYKTL